MDALVVKSWSNERPRTIKQQAGGVSPPYASGRARSAVKPWWSNPGQTWSNPGQTRERERGRRDRAHLEAQVGGVVLLALQVERPGAQLMDALLDEELGLGEAQNGRPRPPELERRRGVLRRGRPPMGRRGCPTKRQCQTGGQIRRSQSGGQIKPPGRWRPRRGCPGGPTAGPTWARSRPGWSNQRSNRWSNRRSNQGSKQGSKQD